MSVAATRPCGASAHRLRAVCLCGLFDMYFQADLAQPSLVCTDFRLSAAAELFRPAVFCCHHFTLPPVAWGDHAIRFVPGSACILCHLTESERDWCTAKAGPPRPVVWFHFFSAVEARRFRFQFRADTYPEAVSTCLTCPLRCLLTFLLLQLCGVPVVWDCQAPPGGDHTTASPLG